MSHPLFTAGSGASPRFLQAAYGAGFLDETPTTAPLIPQNAQDAQNAQNARGVDAFAEGPSYDPDVHGSIHQFLCHEDFDRFQRRARRNVDALIDFARAQGLPAAMSELGDFRTMLFDLDGLDHHRAYGERELALMYGAGARALDRLVPLVRDGAATLETRRTELQQLTPQLLVCAPGALNSLHDCESRLAPGRASLAGKFRSTVSDVIAQVAVHKVESAYLNELSAAHLDQTHHVSGLLAQLHQALDLGWKRPEDFFAHKHPPELVDACVKELTPLLAPVAVARTLAQDYLERFSEAMREKARRPDPTSGSASGAASGSARGSAMDPTWVDSCVDTLKGEFGCIPPTHALIREQPHASQGCGLVGDPALVALHMLDALKADGVIQETRVPETLAAWPLTLAGLSRPTLCRLLSLDGLTWVEEGRQRRPVEAQDLRPLDPGKLSAPLVLAAITDSSSEDLLACVRPAWLLSAQICVRLMARLGREAVRAMILARETAGTWPDELRHELAQALARSDAPGRLTWTDDIGTQALTQGEIHQWLEDRATRRIPFPTLRAQLSNSLSPALIAADDVTGPAAGPRPSPVRGSAHALPIDTPVRAWLAAVGGALRAEPPRLTPAELVEVLTTADDAGAVPWVRCLSTAHEDVVAVLHQGLEELARDGLLPVDALVDRLRGEAVTPERWTSRLTSFSPAGLQAFFKLVTSAAAAGRLDRDRCGELFGTAGGTAVSNTPALACFEMARHDDARRLRTCLVALGEAASRGLLSDPDLRRLTGAECPGNPVGLAWGNAPVQKIERTAVSRALTVWFRGVTDLCVSGSGHLSAQEALARMGRPPRPTLDPTELSWRLQIMTHLLGSVVPLERAGLRPRESDAVTRRRQQLLRAAASFEEAVPPGDALRCGFLKDVRLLNDLTGSDVVGSSARIRVAHAHIAEVMENLRFDADEIAAVTALSSYESSPLERLQSLFGSILDTSRQTP